MNRVVSSVLCGGLLLAATVGSAAHDFSWTFSAAGPDDYLITEWSNYGVFGDSMPRTDPVIQLFQDSRYAVTITNTATPGFEIIAKGASPAEDVVVLSLQGGGSLQSDPGIAFSVTQDAGTATAEFTVTPALVAALKQNGRTPGYRSPSSPGTMRGDFLIFNVGTIITNPLPPVPASDLRVGLELFASGLESPLGVAFPDDATGRAFIYEQIGLIHVQQNGVILPEPLLDVRPWMICEVANTGGPCRLDVVHGHFINFDERGLLGLALHPNFAENGLLYTHVSEKVSGTADFTTQPPGIPPDHQVVISEWRISEENSNKVDVASKRDLLRIDQPDYNHQGGDIVFGNDGFLYIALGDGGGEDDQNHFVFFEDETVISAGHTPYGNSQDITNIHGNILRIDVDARTSANGQYGVPPDNPFIGADGLDEIFAYGFRNPYRIAIDPFSDKLYVADVGQETVEEVSIIGKGDNAGWPVKEGSFWFDPLTTGMYTTKGRIVTEPVFPVPPNLVDPVAQYSHDGATVASEIGGFVYLGQEIPELHGKYVWGDFGYWTVPAHGRMFFLDDGNVMKEFLVGTNGERPQMWIRGWARDLEGEMYVMGSQNLGAFSGATGVIYRLIGPEQHNWSIK